MRLFLLFFCTLNFLACGQNHHLTDKIIESLTVPSEPIEPPPPSPPVESGLCTSLATNSPTIVIGAGTPADPYIICNVQQLQQVKDDLAAHYELGQNIDASETNGWTTGTSGTGFIPIGGCGSDYGNCGSGREYFTGSFNGNGFTINGLFINRTRGGVGLFGATAGCSVITNLRLTNANITGSEDTGGIAARLYNELSKAYFSGIVSGGAKTGGLVGVSRGTIVTTDAQVNVTCTGADCGGAVGDINGRAAVVSVSGTVSGTSRVGGFAGAGGNSYFHAVNTAVNTFGTTQVGGFIGYSDTTNGQQLSASGNVSGSGTEVGGFTGYSKFDYIYDSFATGNVSGNGSTGGFQGYNYYGYKSARNFATGDVNGGSGNDIGAFIGTGDSSDAGAADSFATGTVTGTGSNVGGFIGNNTGSLTNSYHDTNEARFYNMADVVYTSGSAWPFVSSSVSKVWAIVPGGLPRFATIADETLSAPGAGTEEDPKVITSPAQFNELQSFAARTLHIKFGSDLDFSSPLVKALGQDDFPHLGNIDGNNKTVSNLGESLVDKIFSPVIKNFNITSSTVSDQGSIAVDCSGCTVSNIVTTGLSVNDPGGFIFSNIGGLFGAASCADISNVNVTASVTANLSNMGGVVGSLSGTLRDSTASVIVNGTGGSASTVGGIAGVGGNITNTTISGSVNGSLESGGVVGRGGGTLSNVVSTVSVSSGGEAGGLIGNATGAVISRSRATGNVNSGDRTGGLVGKSTGITIVNSYMTGDVNSISGQSGGLVGILSPGASASFIENSYYSGVYNSATGQVGAIIGNNSTTTPITITNVFATDGPASVIYSGPATVTNTVVNTPEATFYDPAHAVYTGVPPWDFTNIWVSPGGSSLPSLQ